MISDHLKSKIKELFIRKYEIGQIATVKCFGVPIAYKIGDQVFVLGVRLI